MTQKITPFLWFDGQAEEAMKFYTSVFPRSKVVEVMRYGEEGPGPAGSVMSATFELDGTRFTALNGGPMYQFTPAVSFFVPCKTQAEIDHYWKALGDGGEEMMCGWLTDRFGVTWQVVPEKLGAMLADEDAEKAGRAMRAMLKMKKLDLATLERAHRGG